MREFPQLPIDGVLLPRQGMRRCEVRYIEEGEISLAESLQKDVAQSVSPEIYHVVEEENWYRKRYEDSFFVGVFLPESEEKGAENPLIALLRVGYLGESEYANVLGWRGEESAEAADVDDVIVRAEYRGNGLQRLLLEVGECVCEAMGIRGMLACVSPENKPSLRNFLRSGYLRQGEYSLYGGKARIIVKKGIGPMKAKRALLLIDYTVDFVAEDGKLTAGAAAQAIEDAIASRVRTALDEGEEIYVLNDIHYEGDVDHPESKLFPPHNIAGTEGRELYGKVKNAVEEAEAAAPERLHRMEKTRYSAFARTGLGQMLLDKGISQVQLAGVCTDICILHTAVDAYNLGFDIIVDAGEVASFNPEGHDFALAHFKNVLGATVID